MEFKQCCFFVLKQCIAIGLANTKTDGIQIVITRYIKAKHFWHWYRALTVKRSNIVIQYLKPIPKRPSEAMLLRLFLPSILKQSVQLTAGERFLIFCPKFVLRSIVCKTKYAFIIGHTYLRCAWVHSVLN